MNAPLPVGFHRNIPLEAYLKLPGASSSRLRMMDVAPAKVRHDIDHPQEPTDAFRFGDALHAAVLEPDRFDRSFVVADTCEATKRDGARCDNTGKVLHRDKGWLCGVHAKPYDDTEFLPFGTIISREWFDACLRARDNALIHSKSARSFLSTFEGDVELTGWWNDARHDIGCRLRGDRVVDLTATCVDVKTTDDASVESFSKSIWNFGYHSQQGFYNDGFQQLDRPMRHHVIVAIEKKPPNLVAVYRMVDPLVEAGRQQMRDALARFAECQRTGVWPPYPDEVRDIGVPPWAWTKLERFLGEGTLTPTAVSYGMELQV